MRISIGLSVFAILLFLTNCAYQPGRGGLLEQYHSISVPFIEGDRDGHFTASLVKELTQSSSHHYCTSNGELILSVTLLDIYDRNIGWRYDIDKEEKETHSLIPTESRLFALAEVTVFNAQTQCPLLGPFKIDAQIDFDHDFYSSRDGINTFSLGQLSDIEVARETALTPLYKQLSKNIVDVITCAW